jgi:hypothetical protein
LGYSPEAIEQALQWRGESGKAVRCLVEAGYLDKSGDGYKAHDWEGNQGHIHALKVRNKKAAINRWKNIKNRSSTVDTSGIPHSVSGMPQTKPDQTRPKQKKEPPFFDSPPAKAKVKVGDLKARISASITEKKQLQKPYVLTENERDSLKRDSLRYGPHVVLACWERWWFTGENWSDWAFRCGHGISGFLSSSGIGAILDSKRWQKRAAEIEKELASA